MNSRLCAISFEGAEGGYFFSLNCDRLMDCIWRKAAETIFAAIFQNEFNRFAQTSAGFVFGLSLTVRSRNLWAIGNEPMTILLNDCREFVCHDWPLFIPVSLTQDREKTRAEVRLTACRSAASGAILFSDWPNPHAPIVGLQRRVM